MEGTEKVAKLDLSHQALEQFVRFLYGFDLDLDFDLDIITELVFFAAVCGLDDLQKAAASAACGRIGLKVKTGSFLNFLKNVSGSNCDGF